MADEKRPSGTVPMGKPERAATPLDARRSGNLPTPLPPLRSGHPTPPAADPRRTPASVPMARKSDSVIMPAPTTRPTTLGGIPVVSAPGAPRDAGMSFQPRAPRSSVVVPVRYKYESFSAFLDSQSVNVSRTGMFVACGESLPIGTVVDFEFHLADGFAILKGKAEVVRISQGPPTGMGWRFRQLDDASKKLIERIIEVNVREGKKPNVAMDFTEAAFADGRTGATPSAPGVMFDGRNLRVQVSPGSVAFFTANPLLNIRLGGFVVPCEEDVPLGTAFDVTLTSAGGLTLFEGKGKVVAKHDLRLGIRLTYTDKTAIAQLQAEIAKLAPSK